MTPPSLANNRSLAAAFAVLRGAATTTGRALRTASLTLAAVALGAGSSWYAINSGLWFNTATYGAWTLWTQDGALNTEPYSRARYAGIGMLVHGSDRIVRYEARVDDDWRRLHSSCTYRVDVPSLRAAWWSIAVFDSSGRKIANEASRYGFNRRTAARSPDGMTTIVVARDASAGNWLPSGSAGRLVLILELIEPDIEPSTGRPISQPPPVRRLSC